MMSCIPMGLASISDNADIKVNVRDAPVLILSSLEAVIDVPA